MVLGGAGTNNLAAPASPWRSALASANRAEAVSRNRIAHPILSTVARIQPPQKWYRVEGFRTVHLCREQSFYLGDSSQLPVAPLS